MRRGGQIFKPWTTPDEWAQVVKEAGCRAAYCPVKPGADNAVIRAYAQAASKADIVIAEVGAWSNPSAPTQPPARQP